MTDGEDFRGTYRRYAGAVGYLCVEDNRGNLGRGTAFHIGEGYWITAKHVIDGKQVVGLGVTTGDVLVDKGAKAEYGERIDSQYTSVTVVGAAHPDTDVDVALLLTPGFTPDGVITLGADAQPAASALVLERVLLMGFPPIPRASDETPSLVATTGEVTAVATVHGRPHIFVSPIARGGFSGGPVLRADGECLGVATDEVFDTDTTDTSVSRGPGFFAVLGVNEVRTLLENWLVVPKDQKHVRSVAELVADIERRAEERREAVRRGLVAPRYFISASDGARATCGYGSRDSEADARLAADQIAEKDASRSQGPRWAAVHVFREGDAGKPVYSSLVSKPKG